MLGCLLTMCCLLGGGDTAVVELHSHPRLRGARIRLDDVAAIHCQDQSLGQALAAIDLGARPEGAWVRTLERGQIEQAIRNAGVDLDQVRLQGANRVAASSEHRTLSRDELHAAAERTLRAHLQRCGELDVELESLAPVPNLEAPPGRSGLELRVALRDDRVHRSSALLDVTIVVDGAEWRTLPVGLRIKRFREAVVAQRPVQTGQPIVPEDLAVRRVETSTLLLEPIQELELLRGLVAARLLRAGQPITANDVRPAPLVRGGAPVSLVAKVGRVTITTKAVAQQDGAKDELIPVLNLSTRAVVMARVEENGVVVVGEEQ